MEENADKIIGNYLAFIRKDQIVAEEKKVVEFTLEDFKLL